VLSFARGQTQEDPAVEWVFSRRFYHITDDGAVEVDEQAVRESNIPELLKQMDAVKSR